MGRNPRSLAKRRHSHTDFGREPARLSEDSLYRELSAKRDDAFLLILDGVQDPHNLGACLRSADAAGVDAVIVPRHKSAGLTDVVRRVACGAAEHTPVVEVTNLARCLQNLQEAGVWLVATGDEAAETIHSVDLTGPLGIVMGAEGRGLRRLTRERCDFGVRIPMAPGARVDCLNVSVATGIALFEARRQRDAAVPSHGRPAQKS